jgi:hypothetical protein
VAAKAAHQNEWQRKLQNERQHKLFIRTIGRASCSSGLR